MSEVAPPLIPRPSDVEWGPTSEAFVLDAGVSIVIAPECAFAARELQSTIHEATGLYLPLRTNAATRSITLRLAFEDDLGSESYRLTVTASGIAITGQTNAGVFYGVQTLKQLLRTRGARIPAVEIRDRPVLPHRGVMLDVSRGKVPTLSTLFALVDRLAEYKYNQLQLYIEHTFDFPSHPDIGAGCDPLTSDDMLRLDEYCRARHVELVPNLQSFGHQRHMLSMPQYAHLDEVGWRWSLTPARDETYELLDELYADFLPNFSSTWLNVDCDETWDLATGQSKQLASRIGKGRVYLQHILRLRELAARQDRKIMLWADVLHHYPDLVGELPEDVLLLDWEYEAQDHYMTTNALGKSGRRFWVCPGTSSWNTLFPRLDNAVTNIRNFVRDGLSAGATGMVLTDWGDYGHYQPYSLSWYPYVFGAATAWTGAATSFEDFDDAFAPLFLGRPAGDASLLCMRRLGRAVTAPSLGLHNRSNLALMLFEDPLSGQASVSADPSALCEVAAAATEAISAWATLPDADLRHDYGFVARLVAFAAAKAQLTQEIGRGSATIAALEAHQARIPALRAEFEERWLESARRSEIHLTLRHFDLLSQSYAKALEWLRNPVGAYEPLATPLLWEQGRAEIRKLTELTGDGENVPELEQG